METGNSRNVLKWAKYILTIIGIGIVIIVYLYFTQKKEDEILRASLSRMLNIDQQYLNLNLPPQLGRYPGSVVIRPERGSFLNVYIEGRAINADSVPVSNITLASSLAESAQFEYGLDPFASTTKSSGDIIVSVELKNLRVLEFPGGIGKLREKLLGNAEVKRQREKELEPEVIVKAIEATPVFTIKKGSSITGEAWQEKANEFQVKLGATLDNSGSLIMTTNAPVIVAYETQRISYLATRLDPGAPETINLKPVKASSETQFKWARAPKIEAAEEDDDEKEEQVKIGFVTIGNGKYRHRQLGDLPAVPASQKLTYESLLALGAEPVGEQFKNKQEWTKKELLDAITKIKAEAREKNITNLIFYYVGHSSIAGNGYTYLFMSDHTEEIEMITGGPIEGETFGDSIVYPNDYGELCEGMNAGSDYPPSPEEGTVNLYEIHSLLEEGNELLFAILIDGCSVRSGSGQVNTRMDIEYDVGHTPNEREKRGLLELLDKCATPTIMKGEMLIILAQRPGVAAVTVKHPYWQGVGPDVGPLSAFLFTRAMHIRMNPHNRHWGAYLNSIVEIDGTSEWQKSGSISWSQSLGWDDVKLRVK